MARELRREIRRWEVVALTFNVVVGAGIFGLPSKIFQIAGVWSLAGLLACAVLVALLNLTLVELSARFIATGGPYVYTAQAFGPGVGFLVGWLIWAMRVTAMAAMLVLCIDYLAGIAPVFAHPVPRAALEIAIVAVLTVLNLAGVRAAMAANNFFTIGKLVPLLALAFVGLAFVEPARLSPASPPELSSIARTAMLCVFAFTGFETATIIAGEMRDPRRDLPFALLATTVAVAVIYALVQIVCIGTVPGLGGSMRPLADAGAQLAGRAGAAALTIGAVVSVLGILMALMTAAPRLLFAMAEAGELPAALGAVAPRRQTPDAAVGLTAAVVLALALTGTFVGIVAVSTAIRLVTYAITAVAVPALRRREGRGLWGGVAGLPVIVLSIGLTAWMLSSVRLHEAVLAGGLAAAGLALRYALRWPR